MEAHTLTLVAAWYASSLFSIVTVKLTLQSVHVPTLLCLLQLSVAALLQRLYLALLPPPASGGSRGPCALGKEATLVRAIALVYSLGFALTNVAFASAAPSAVETIKSGEPVATVALAALVLGERERLLTYSSLAPTVVGTAMASVGGGAAPPGLSAVAATMASNLAFAGRAVLVKALKRDHPGSACALSDLQLFYHVSCLGALLLVPLALWEAHASGAALAAQIGSSPALLAAMLANSVAHASYNQLSFQVLSRVATSTHAMLNIARRLCLIVATVIFFRTPMDLYNWIGVGLAVGGVLLFAREKGRRAARLG
eukprot:1032601-Prymnesium_polylepis.1